MKNTMDIMVTAKAKASQTPSVLGTWVKRCEQVKYSLDFAVLSRTLNYPRLSLISGIMKNTMDIMIKALVVFITDQQRMSECLNIGTETFSHLNSRSYDLYYYKRSHIIISSTWLLREKQTA